MERFIAMEIEGNFIYIHDGKTEADGKIYGDGI